jgi:hypothetical protein
MRIREARCVFRENSATLRRLEVLGSKVSANSVVTADLGSVWLIAPSFGQSTATLKARIKLAAFSDVARSLLYNEPNCT